MRVRRQFHRPKQVDPARVLPAGEPGEFLDERLLPAGELGQAVLDRSPVSELVQPLSAGPELARGLGAAQQQHGDQRTLAGIKTERLVEELVELQSPLAAPVPDHPHQPFSLQRARTGLDRLVAVVDDRVPAGALVARRAQRVDAEGIAGGHGDLLLQQGPQDPLLGGLQMWQGRHVSSFRPLNQCLLPHGRACLVAARHRAGSGSSSPPRPGGGRDRPPTRSVPRPSRGPAPSASQAATPRPPASQAGYPDRAPGP